MTKLLYIPDALLFPRILLRIWRTSRVRSRTLVLVLACTEMPPLTPFFCAGTCARADYADLSGWPLLPATLAQAGLSQAGPTGWRGHGARVGRPIRLQEEVQPCWY
jgi:hypothetical protein